MFRGTERGAATASLLGDIINQAIAALPIAKRMRWGARTAEFVRPVHSVVLLYGETVIPAEVLGLATGRVTFGHRFHAPEAHYAQVAPRATRAGCGAPRWSRISRERRELIRAGVTAAAAATGERRHGIDRRCAAR